MSTSYFIKELYPFIVSKGWHAGINEYSRSPFTAKSIQAQTYRDFLQFSSLQSLWKLLLPETFDLDVFIADTSLGAIPLDLSKSFRRVLTWSFYEHAFEIVSERVREAGVSNVFVHERIDAMELREQGYKIGLSIIIVTEDLLTQLGKTAALDKIETFLGKLEKASSKEWTNVFLYPKKFCLRFPFKVYNIHNQMGISSSVLKMLGQQHQLRASYIYHCRYTPENVVEINIPNTQSLVRKTLQSRSLRDFYDNLKSILKNEPLTFPFKILALSKKKQPSIWLDGFLSYFTNKGLFDTRVSVQRYIAGHPNMILLEFRTISGDGFICRMPLGRGTSLPRASNNYSTLRNLQFIERLSKIIPQPIDHGVFQGQPYFIETLLCGSKVKLTHENHFEVYKSIRPVLLSFYSGLGQDVVIDMSVFESLLGDSLSMIRNNARDRNDLEKVATLETLLKERFLNTTTRLPLVHGDFKIENMLFNSKELRGIFDWDLSMRFGFPFIDLFYLLGYSFHYKTEVYKGDIMDFITSQLLTGNYDTKLEMYYEDYRRSLGISKDWKIWAGILFWLHYITKITRIAFLTYDTHLYNRNFRRPIEIIMKRMSHLQ
jgi:hypothetical protein